MEKNFLKKLKKKLPFKKKAETSEKLPETEKNKNEITILDKDLEDIFTEGKNIPKQNTKTDIKTSEKKSVQNNKKIKPQKTKAQPKARSNVKINKHNIPLIDDTEDLIKSFKEKKDTPYQPKKIIVRPEKKINKEDIKKKKTIKNKNGIRVIDDFSDIYDSFLDSGEMIKASKDAYKNESALLKTKKDSPNPKKPLSLEKRLQRYPAPELSLDLHGFTSVQARLKSENFILSSYKKGYFTLRIITGKGIHSDAGAVLPDITEDIVKELMAQKKVLSYSWENKGGSRSGSMVVYLNRFD